MILVAILVVAVVAKEALKGYGLAPATAVSARSGTPADRARTPGAGGIEAIDPGAAPVTPANAIERARGVEEMLKQQAAEHAARGDGTTQ